MSFRLLFDCFGSNHSFSAFAMPTEMDGEKPLKTNGKHPKAVPGGPDGRKVFGTMIVPATRSDWRGWHNFRAFSKLPGEEKFWTLAASGARRHFKKNRRLALPKRCRRCALPAWSRNKKPRTISSGA
jgi:hypothetical protein